MAYVKPLFSIITSLFNRNIMLTPITKATCPEARAGIRKLYAIDCTDIDSLTFNEGGAISAITAASGAEFVPIEFELNTAFFNQNKVRPNGKGTVIVNQSIEFTEEGIVQLVNESLRKLNKSCCLHIVVKDNNNKMWYAGISRDGETGNLYLDEDMRTGEGSAVTGASQESDSAMTKETLVARTRWYAPQYVGLESAIPVA